MLSYSVVSNSLQPHRLAHLGPLSRQEYWSGLPRSTPKSMLPHKACFLPISYWPVYQSCYQNYVYKLDIIHMEMYICILNNSKIQIFYKSNIYIKSGINMNVLTTINIKNFKQNVPSSFNFSPLSFATWSLGIYYRIFWILLKFIENNDGRRFKIWLKEVLFDQKLISLKILCMRIFNLALTTD